jgi:hypothetical protein
VGTYASQRDAGSGVFRVRCVVSGWPEVFVTDSSLLLTESDGRERILGLDPMPLRIEARADLARGGLTDGEQSIRVVDGDAHLATAALGKLPASKTWLTAALTRTATTAQVASTAGFPSSGVIHIHTEAIAYSGKTATTFTGLTRGHWDTTSQRHEGPDGDRLPGSAVTDRPVGLHGRYVRLYLYGRADAASGGGTLKWQGTARTDRSYQGGAWQWAASGLASRLDQSVGRDLEEPVGLSGIYLPATGALALSLSRRSTAALTGDTTSDGWAEPIRLSGRWETQDAFVDDLNTAIDSHVSTWSWGAGAQIQAESLGPTGWRLIYRTDGTTAHYVQVGGSGSSEEAPGRGDGAPTFDLVSPVDRLDTLSSGVGGWRDQTGAVVEELDAGGVYTCDVVAPVPRGAVGDHGAGFTDRASPENTADRLYLAGRLGLSADMWAVLMPDGEESDEQSFAAVESASTSERRITVPGLATAALGPETRVKLARELATNQNVGGLITLIFANSPNLVNSARCRSSRGATSTSTSTR